MSRPEAETSLGLFRVMCIAAAVWSIGAGVIHFLSVGEHRSHALMAAFFVVTAIAQIGWGVWLVLRPSRWLLIAGIAGNLAVVGVWVLTRTTGLAFVPGAEHPEPIGFKDVVATLLEALSAGAAGLALAMSAAAASIMLTGARRSVVVASVLALVLVAPAALVEGHEHGHSADTHAHGAAGEHPHGVHGDEHDGAEAHGDGAGAKRHDGHGADGHGADGHGADGSHDASSGHGPGMQSGRHEHGQGGHPGGGGNDHGTGGGHDHGDGGHGDGGHGDHAKPETFPQPEMWGQKTTMRIGPFPLGAADRTGGMHFNRFGPIPRKPCQSCYITGIVPRLVYADGSPADVDTGPMLHHIVLFDTGEYDRTCRRWNGDGMVGQRVFAAGNERVTYSLPRGYGYRSTASPWGYAIELMNMTNEVKTVYFEADVYYVPASTPGMKPVTPLWMDVANCRFSEYDVPAGRSVKRWTWESSVTGRVVSAGGHVHNGGVGLILSNKTTGRRMCTSEAAYGTGPFKAEVVDMSSCIWDRIGTVREGQQLELASIYDTTKPLGDVMGISVVSVYETDDLGGGRPAPAWMRRDPDTEPPDSGHHPH